MKTKITKPLRWNPRVDCNLAFANEHMSEEASNLFMELSRCSKTQDGIIKSGKYFFRSLPVNIQYFSLVFDQIRMAKRFMTEIVYCLKGMGFKVNINKVYWNNTPDSGENIGGYVGFYVVELNLKK